MKHYQNMKNNRPKNPRLTVEYLDALRDLKKRRDFRSSFGFLSTHNGIRKGKLHVLVAPTSGGKSTLARSLLFDTLDNNPDKNVFLYLSEESEANFLKELADSNYRNQEGLDRLDIYSEIDADSKITFKQLKEHLIKTDAGIFFYDNLTTSQLYEEKRVSDQTQVVKRLKEIINELNIPLFIFAHTGAEVTENIKRQITGNDIRGAKAITNYAEFLYVLQGIHTEFYDNLLRKRTPKIFSIIHIKKHRGENVGNKIFLLKYNEVERVYCEDR